MDPITLIGLVSALVSTGVNIVKGVKQRKETKKAEARSEAMAAEEEELNRRRKKEAIQKMILNQLGGRLALSPRDYTPKLKPYEMADLSGYDMASQSIGAAGQLATGIAQNKGAEKPNTQEGLAKPAAMGSVSNPLPAAGYGQSTPAESGKWRRFLQNRYRSNDMNIPGYY